MLRVGENELRGIPVEVVRGRARRISVRVTPDARVRLMVPLRGATLAEGEEFLLSKWRWVERTRAAAAANPPPPPPAPVGAAELERLHALLGELGARWAARLGEEGVTWRTRRMKTLWGSCHVRARSVTYSTDLARVPRELVEYVVVHELTHLRVANHGPAFGRLMDARLPGWRALRSRLNRRGYAPAGVPYQALLDL